MAVKKFKGKNSIFAAVGAATGLGNAFRFPALCVSYGAVFILAYALVLALVCFPLLTAELHFGRKSISGRGAKVWSVIMFAAAINSAFIALYYGVIAAKLGATSLSFALFSNPQTNPSILFAAALFAVLTAAYALIKGSSRALSASGKLSVCLSLALFCCLAVAGGVRGGAFSSFNCSALARGSIWLDALGQSLLALSLAAGVMPSYAKSLPQGASSVGASLKIVIANLIICMLATLSVLPFSVTFSRTVGVSCAINAYSQVIFALFSGGAGARIAGTVLFAILTVVAVHSLASLAFPVLTAVGAKFRFAPLAFCVAAACLAPLFLAGNMRVLSVCDKLACSVNAVVIAVAECLFFLSQRDITGAIALKLSKRVKFKRKNARLENGSVAEKILQ